MDKILRINMGADGGPEIKTEPLGDYAGLGGRAMTSGIVAKEVPPLCHPPRRGQQTGDRPGDAERFCGGDVRSNFSRLQKSVDRRDQGIKLRRTAIPDARQTGIRRHRIGRQTQGKSTF